MIQAAGSVSMRRCPSVGNIDENAAWRELLFAAPVLAHRLHMAAFAGMQDYILDNRLQVSITPCNISHATRSLSIPPHLVHAYL